MFPAHSLRSLSNAFLARRRWASMPEEDLSPGMWRDAASPITRRAASSAFLTAPPRYWPLSPGTGAADAPSPRGGLSFFSFRPTSSDGSIVAARPEDCRSDIIAMAVS